MSNSQTSTTRDTATANHAPGELISSEPYAYPGVTKILYSTTDVHGRPVTTSGTVIQPIKQWEGEGSTPTIVFAPSTRGATDICAPSNAIAMIANADFKGRNVNVNYELPWNLHAALKGIRVVVIDYIGLGTPGVHTYMLTAEQAHAMLDAARAVAGDGPVGFYGYSQGGNAAAGAAEYAASYAPELDIRGTYAGAPPANLREVLDSVDGSLLMGVIAYAVNGFGERYPEFRESFTEYLNDEGKRYLEDNLTNCAIDTRFKWGLRKTSEFTTTGESFGEIFARCPEFGDRFDEHNLGKGPVTGPIVISSSTVDDLVPHEQVVQLAKDYRAAGSTVAFVGHEKRSLTGGRPFGLDHILGLFPDTPKALNYLVDRFNGVPAPTTD